MRGKLFLNKSGFNIAGLMIAVGLGGVIMAGITTLIVNSHRDQRRLGALFNVQQIQKNMSNMISSDLVWKAIIDGNEKLKCLKSGSGVLCDSGLVDDIVIYTGAGVEFFNPQKHGFELSGVICDLSKSDCPLKLKMSVQLTCPGNPALATCATPDQILAKGTFVPNPKVDSLKVFNPENYIVQVRKDVFAASASTGGTVIYLKCGVSLPKPGAVWDFAVVNACAPTPDKGCLPANCPSGFTDLGVSTETTGTSGIVSGTVSLSANCVRVCLK